MEFETKALAKQQSWGMPRKRSGCVEGYMTPEGKVAGHGICAFRSQVVFSDVYTEELQEFKARDILYAEKNSAQYS